MPPDQSDEASETRFCVNCGEEIPASTNYCSHCGTEQPGVGTQSGQRAESEESPKETASEETSASIHHRLPGISEQNSTRRNVLVGSGYGILGLAVIGALSSGGDDAGTSGSSGGSEGGGNDGGGNTPTPVPYPDAWYYDKATGIVLRDVEGSVGQFSAEITGVAVNESDQNYEYVQLNFGLYDSTDAKVGDALANTSGLEAGQRWRFKAIGTQTENVDSFSIEGVTAY